MKRVYHRLARMLLVLLVLCLVGPGAYAQGYHFTYAIGGPVDGQRNAPTGVAVAPSGNVIVVDSYNDRVQILDSYDAVIEIRLLAHARDALSPMSTIHLGARLKRILSHAKGP